MKKISEKLPAIQLVFFSLLPAIKIISRIFGRKVILYNGMASYIVIFSMCLVLTILCFVKKPKISTAQSVCCMLMPIIAVVNGVCYYSYAPETSFFLTPFCIIISLLMLIQFVPKGAAKVISGIASVIIIIVYLVYCIALLLASMLGSRTVVKQVKSPSGAYTARIVDNDGGATGGSTEVEIIEGKVINLGVLSLEPYGKNVYSGAWGEFQTMTLEWENEEVILINGKQYSIK